VVLRAACERGKRATAALSALAPRRLAILSRNKRRARKVLALTVPTRTPRVFSRFSGGEFADFGEVDDGFQDWAEFVDCAGQNVVNLQLAIFFFGRCGRSLISSVKLSSSTV